ncbi:hypothetical protein [Devosia chinhatensis]|nr:hypothetical protein [Devosia chinhatensis]
MSELEIALVGVAILVGACGILYAGLRAPGEQGTPADTAGPSDRADTP